MTATTFSLQVNENNQVIVSLIDGNATPPVFSYLASQQVFTVFAQLGQIVPTTATFPPGTPMVLCQLTLSSLVLSTLSTVVEVTVTPGSGPLSGAPAQTCLVSVDPGGQVVTNMCVTDYTRPYYRDAIRRKLSVTPPIDTLPGAVPGQEPAGQAWPSNPLVNDAISNAIREINRDCRYFTMTNINLSVTAELATYQGPQWIPLAGVAGQAGQNIVQKILRVVWNDGAGTIYTLLPINWRSLDRAQFQFDSLFPSSPRWYIMEAYQIGILPALSTNGTLMIWAGTGITNFCSDTDTLNQLPVDYQEVVEDLAVLKLNKSNPDKPMSKEQLAIFQQSAKEGKDAIVKWASTISGLQQSNITFESHRLYRIH